MQKIKIEQITVGNNRRKLGDFAELAKSINEIGLINPIQVNEQFNLIAGLHRVEACRSLGWDEIDAVVLSVNDIKAERIEIAENLFRNDLTTLERSQQYKRLKDLYEAEHPETKNGGDRKSEKIRSQILPSDTPSFVKDVAGKINVSESTIKQEVQIATHIPEPIQEAIKDLPIADRKTDLLKLSRLNETAQKEVVAVLATGKVETYDEAVKVIDDVFQASQPQPTIRQKTRSNWLNLIDKMSDFLFSASTGTTIELAVENLTERERDVFLTNATRLTERLNQWIEVLERQGATNNDSKEPYNQNVATANTERVYI